MTAPKSDGLKFDNIIIDSISKENRETLKIFSDSIKHGEEILRAYHHNIKILENKENYSLEDKIKSDSRAVFALIWAKATLFARSIVINMNSGNLLVVFLSLRAYVEMISTSRYVSNKIRAIMMNSADSGQITPENAQEISRNLDLLLHGGNFNWKIYFEDGAQATLNRKKISRTKEERKTHAARTLRVTDCVDDWSKAVPAAEFVYDYLCDLVHPNKGSNLVLLINSHGKLIFDIDKTSSLGMMIFERIFPTSASLCLQEMASIAWIFGLLGGEADMPAETPLARAHTPI